MKKILLGLFLFGSLHSYSQYNYNDHRSPFLKATDSTDSAKVVNDLRGNWKYVSRYYLPIYANIKRITHPTFVISDTAFIV